MAYSIKYSTQFKKSLRLCCKRGLDRNLIANVIQILVENGCLPDIYHPHKLSGEYTGCWECHIKPDWLLIWKQYDDELLLLLVDTGTHSDLFGK